LSPLLAVVKMNASDAVIIDVREPHEFIKGAIENAVNVPLGKLESQLGELAQHTDHPVIVVCQTGTRSVPACKTLTKAGFSDVYNIIGGMQSWEENKLPIKIASKNKN
ncbi:MAG TPA: rhodanese-like domain-containing protein, partial [Methylococcaceae bacterium]|nr:rhodanese-like domain-containing protein [Methylococcaceae bacterium]